MEAKVEELVYHLHCWVNGQIVIAVVMSYSRMIHGDYLPSQFSARHGARLGIGFGHVISAINYRL